jgi:hypothetical protein
MENLEWFLLAIMAAYALAGLTPFVRKICGFRFGFGLVAIILVCPLIIPSASVGLRAASAFASGEIGFKLIDYFRQLRQKENPLSVREFFRMLIPFPVFSTVYPDHKRRLSSPDKLWPNLLRIVLGIAGCIIAVSTLKAFSQVDLVRSNFAINHIVMLLTFVIAIESLSRVCYGLELLAGFDTTPIIRNAFLSRSIFEFWQRYNYRIHDWLYHNVFVPTGGRRNPIRSTLLVFFVSGVFHELMFTIATSRLTGYQLAFFSIQGPAAIASVRLAKRRGIKAQIVSHLVTMLFMGCSSVLFFDGVARIFPFLYVSQSPLQ